MADEQTPEFEIDGEEQHHLRLRTLREQDYDDVARIMNRVYSDIGGAWTLEEYLAQLSVFPEGQICIADDGKVVGVALSVVVDYDRFTRQHTYDEVTAGASFNSHKPEGDALYGIDLFVDPGYRDMRLGRRLYDARKELCRSLNLRAMLTGGRIPRFSDAGDDISPHEYIRRVRDHVIHDPILRFQLANDLQVKRVLKNYMPEDEKSGGYATLLEWTNIYFEEPDKRLFAPARKSVVRVGTVQWQMRPTRELEQLFTQIEFFVDAMADYKSDFVVFPEFFAAPLMGESSDDNPTAAARRLAEHTPAIHDHMVKLAMSYNINIIAGSMPMLDEGKLYNVGWLCRRDGTSESQAKLQVTPDEKRFWALQGGNQLRVFDTDVAKIGILICYDVEFPELARLMAQEGMQILFVPFWTDTKNAYLRVRRCAQARAIENECYVAISGSVGNLPRVANADIQYAQSAVFSPSDFAFPHDAVMAESTPNTEMTLLSDLDMDKLKRLRQEGSVRNTLDRRTDLYEVRWVGDYPLSSASGEE